MIFFCHQTFFCIPRIGHRIYCGKKEKMWILQAFFHIIVDTSHIRRTGPAMIAAGAFIFADIADFFGKRNLIGGTEAVFADGVIIYQVFKDVPDRHMGYRLSICCLILLFCIIISLITLFCCLNK